MSETLRIGIVGACGSGKSTLIEGLAKHGYSSKHIAQEHSFVQDMWQRLTNPDILIYLDVSFPETLARKHFRWKEKEYLEQNRRLSHAKDHADIYVMTDGQTPEEILQKVLRALDSM